MSGRCYNVYMTQRKSATRSTVGSNPASFVGIRELRDGLSRHLERVKAGDTLTVTEHGRPIARVVPYQRHTLDELIAAGLAVPPTGARPAWPSGPPRLLSGTVMDLLHDR